MFNVSKFRKTHSLQRKVPATILTCLLRVIMQEIAENTDLFRLVYVKFIPTRHILIIATLAINLINITSREDNN